MAYGEIHVLISLSYSAPRNSPGSPADTLHSTSECGSITYIPEELTRHDMASSGLQTLPHSPAVTGRRRHGEVGCASCHGGSWVELPLTIRWIGACWMVGTGEGIAELLSAVVGADILCVCLIGVTEGMDDGSGR